MATAGLNYVMKYRFNMNITNEDNMQLMARYEDNHFDLAIVDPPYGLGDKWIRPGKNAHKAASMAKSNWDNNTPTKEYFNELERVSKNRIIWGGNYFELGSTRCYIVWDKPEMNIYTMSDGELAWTSFNRPLKIVKVSRKTKGLTIHSTQKPVKLYEWILMNYANEGDKILDTHLGSGSIAIACHNLKYDLTACELDTEYYNAAMKRLSNHQLQTKLF